MAITGVYSTWVIDATTVSPTVNPAAFSSHVPSSSRMVSTKRPCTSRFLTAHKICWPTLAPVGGEEMRLTDMQSMEQH